MLRLIRPRSSQPQEIVARPAQRWLQRGLVALVNGATLIDHVSGRPLTLAGGSNRSSSALGLSQQMTGTQYASIPVAGVSGVPTTILAWAQMSNFSGNRVICGLGSSGTVAATGELYFDSTVGAVQFIHNTAGTYAQDRSASSSVVNGTMYMVAGIARDASARWVYLNGAYTFFTGTAPLVAANTFYVGVERYNGAFAGQFQGNIPLAAAFAAELTAAELSELRETPWRLFDERRIWVPVSTGGGSYSASLSESTTTTDAATAAYIATASVAESITAADSLAAATTWVLSLTEAATAAEAITTAGTFAASITEAASTADALTSAVTWARALTEAASASDLATAIVHAVAALTEAATASDSQTTGSIYTGSVAEAASAADALTSVAQWVRLLTEPATAADSVAASAPGIYPVSLAELLEVVDQLVAAFQGLDTPLDAPLFARLAGAAARRVGAASAGATSPRVGRQDIDGSAAH